MWLKDEGIEETTTLNLHYRVPILGHVAVWFTNPIALPGSTEQKNSHYLTAETLLKIAKASRHSLHFNCRLQSSSIFHNGNGAMKDSKSVYNTLQVSII